MWKRNWSAGCAILILAAWVPASRGEDPAARAGAAVKANESVLVFAAASTTNALNEINCAVHQRLRRRRPDELCGLRRPWPSRFSTEPRRILSLSADRKWADYLAKKDQVVRQQDLLGNRLVIVVPADSKTEVKKPEDLLAANIEHLALGEPQSVPAGIYAKQALTKLGLWDQLKAKVVSAADVRRALGYVETGSAEAGIVYATDAAVSKNVRVVAGDS